MATAVHHGPPGSFKSFTLVQRIAIPELIKGRTIVTNIRDFYDLDKIKAAYSGEIFDPKANIMYLPDTEAGRAEMARFFHWAPPGALMLIDEGQKVFPKRKDFKLTDLDRYTPEPGQFIQVVNDIHGNPMRRPEDIWVAFDMQRHWNWDIYISTPNIDKLHDFIRQVSDWAYRHRSLDGVLPWYKGTWYEHQHDPETSGKLPSHVVGSPTRYKVDKRAYQCYSSTATGDHIASKAGRSIFADGRVRTLLIGIFCLLCVFGYLVSGKISAWTAAKAPKTPSVAVSPGVRSAAPAPGPAPGPAAAPRVADTSPPPVDDLIQVVADETVYTVVSAQGGGDYVFLAFRLGRFYRFTTAMLAAKRRFVLRHSDCHYSIHGGGSRVIEVFCDSMHCASESFGPDYFRRSGCEPMDEYITRKYAVSRPSGSDEERERRGARAQAGVGYLTTVAQ